jgi:ABC-type transporter Mla subunit MlaD
MGEIDITSWSPYLILAYIIIKEVLPKLFPTIANAINKRTSTEDRLFRLLENSNTATKELTATLHELHFAVEGLGIALVRLDQRVDKLESAINDTATADFLRWFKTLPAYKDLRKSEIA